MGAQAQRIARAVRDQVELVPQSLEDRVVAEHPPRAIWAMLERLERVDRTLQALPAREAMKKQQRKQGPTAWQDRVDDARVSTRS